MQESVCLERPLKAMLGVTQSETVTESLLPVKQQFSLLENGDTDDFMVVVI